MSGGQTVLRGYNANHYFSPNRKSIPIRISNLNHISNPFPTGTGR